MIETKAKEVTKHNRIRKPKGLNGWILASERLPTDKEMGGFGAVEVIVQCDHKSGVNIHETVDRWQVMRLAICEFIGGDRSRPLWVSADKPHDPVENKAWFVTHWRPFPAFPDPIDRSIFRGY